MTEVKTDAPETQEEKPFLGVIVHSFFIIPFLIAVFCVLLFAAINLLTSEKRTVYDYLEDVKTGGVTKRWQGAFELSRIISSSQFTNEPEFAKDLVNAFKKSVHDDKRVRQFLALAMGRTGDVIYVDPLIEALKTETNSDNIPHLIYALGMLKDSRALKPISQFVDNQDSRIRSIAVVSLGNLQDKQAISILKKSLKDSEPNVQWGSAISLAQMDSLAGKEILIKLLNRNYLNNFPEVDPQEQSQLILSTIEAAQKFNDPQINEAIEVLSKEDKNMKIRNAAMKVMNP